MIIVGVGSASSPSCSSASSSPARSTATAPTSSSPAARLGVPLVAASLMAAAVDSNATVGNTDLTSAFGFWAGASLALGLGDLPAAHRDLPRQADEPDGAVHARRLLPAPVRPRGRGGVVAADDLRVRILMAGNLVACGFLLERFLGLDYTVGVLLSPSAGARLHDRRRDVLRRLHRGHPDRDHGRPPRSAC